VRAALHLGRWVFQPPVPAFGAVEVVAFYEPNCPACRRTRPLLDRLERRYPGYRWARVDLSYPRGRKLAQEYYLHYDVPARRRGTIPMVFAGTRIFTGFAAIRDELPAYLDQGTIARPLGHSASPARPSTGANR
jgi:thiol-disulfide isomerase/thioredoxin